MSNHAHHVDVDVPVRVAYDQWTQFETYPEFMEGVTKVVQGDDAHTHWTVDIAGVTREFDAVVTEQVPDERVAWTTIDGTMQAGVVTFHRLTAQSTRVALQLDFAPSGAVEKVGDVLGFVDRRVEGDLHRFKEFIESRAVPTGQWRGVIDEEAKVASDLRRDVEGDLPVDRGVPGTLSGLPRDDTATT